MDSRFCWGNEPCVAKKWVGCERRRASAGKGSLARELSRCRTMPYTCPRSFPIALLDSSQLIELSPTP